MVKSNLGIIIYGLQTLSLRGTKQSFRLVGGFLNTFASVQQIASYLAMTKPPSTNHKDWFAKLRFVPRNDIIYLILYRIPT